MKDDTLKMSNKVFNDLFKDMNELSTNINEAKQDNILDLRAFHLYSNDYDSDSSDEGDSSDDGNKDKAMD